MAEKGITVNVPQAVAAGDLFQQSQDAVADLGKGYVGKIKSALDDMERQAAGKPTSSSSDVAGPILANVRPALTEVEKAFAGIGGNIELLTENAKKTATIADQMDHEGRQSVRATGPETGRV